MKNIIRTIGYIFIIICISVLSYAIYTIIYLATNDTLFLLFESDSWAENIMDAISMIIAISLGIFGFLLVRLNNKAREYLIYFSYFIIFLTIIKFVYDSTVTRSADVTLFIIDLSVLMAIVILFTRKNIVRCFDNQ